MSSPALYLRKSSEPIQKNTPSFHSNILIVGGAYAGLSALVALKNQLRERGQLQKVSATLVEPKAGLLNVLGIPKAIVDTEFAKTQYIPLQKLDDLTVDYLISNDEYVARTLGKEVRPNNNDHIEVTYVQGSVTTLKTKIAEYKLNNSTDVGFIEFNYVVIATGRCRKWPISPLAYNFESYQAEMREFKEQISKCKTVGVIGAGAVGVEIAGDIKATMPDKEVYLIHPHSKFPPEPLPDDFKDLTHESLARSGVHIKTGYRVKAESEDHELLFTNGEKLKTDFNYWCHAFRNNTSILQPSELQVFISPDNNIYVNDFLQLTHPETKEHLPHAFALGDLVEIPIIKSAGWALYMGRQVATNILSLIFDGVLVEPFPDLSQMPKGMVLVAGNNEIVSSLDGALELNNASYVEEYKDYCIGKIRVTLGA